MMRRLLDLPAILACLTLACSIGLCQTQPRVNVRPVSVQLPKVVILIDGKMMEAESAQVVRGQQVMVWLRDLEKLGWGKTEPGQPGQFVFKSENVTLTFIKGQSVAMVNSLSVRLPVETYLQGGKLMVPLSFVAKSLGYDYKSEEKLIASVVTLPVAKNENGIRGQITFAGKPVRGIRVRAVDTNLNSIPGATATTDADGRFEIEGLPAGEFAAYVFSGDNPTYVSRASGSVKVSGGASAEITPLTLIRAVVPASPKPAGVARVARGLVSFAWSPCEGAASYKLTVKKRGGSATVAEASSSKTKVTVASSKFAPDVTYDARVTALDAAGKALGTTAGATGVEWTFTVDWPM